MSGQVSAAEMVDLRSDTVTRPTPGMRQAIHEAEVGDDWFGDDPTVRVLEERIAELLGKEAALFFPSGTMANITAMLILAPPATEVIVEAHSHIFNWEDGAAAQWGGLQLRPVSTPDGIMDAHKVEAAIRRRGSYQVETSLLCLENTHNFAGGTVFPLSAMIAAAQVARNHGLSVHLDGARIWNAAVARGTDVDRWAAVADTVMVCLSKGLGCPAGSLLAGTRKSMDEAWRIRRRLGGGMRQAGILAAAGIFALQHNRSRLAEDHRRAGLLFDLLDGVNGIRVLKPETNIVMIDLTRQDMDSGVVVEALRDQGVLLVPFGPRRLRAVTHLDVDDAGVRRAAEALARVSGQ